MKRSTIVWALTLSITFVFASPVVTQDRIQPGQPTSAKDVVEKGGKFWSSVPKTKLAKDVEIVAGDRFLIWPVEDQLYAIKRDALIVKFHWQLLPGQKPPGSEDVAQKTKDDIALTLVYRSYGENFLSRKDGVWYTSTMDVRQLETGAKQGTNEATFKLKGGDEPRAVLFSVEEKPLGEIFKRPVMADDIRGKGEMLLMIAPRGAVPKKASSNIIRIVADAG